MGARSGIHDLRGLGLSGNPAVPRSWMIARECTVSSAFIHLSPGVKPRRSRLFAGKQVEFAMRKFLRILIGVAVLALAGCVYPGYTYVRGGYAGGYYTGNAYYYDDAYAAPYYYGGYGWCGWYGPSVNIGVGYYGGGYYHHGYRGYRGRGWSGHSQHGGRHGGDSRGRHH